MNTRDWSTGQTLDTPKSGLRAPSSGVTLWRPDLVLADRKQRVSPPRRLVMPGEPVFRPAAVRAQVDAAKALLRSFTEAHETLEAQAARAEACGHGARSDRERVYAAMETYRVKAEMDDVLTGALRKMTALMEGRTVR
jgi:hypothetical protein